ncbi:MAG: hypothetical protein IT454_16940, partial [Planctomycetes bacterium]|nr:hypothetical protein [Planctomycetota bacterium]
MKALLALAALAAAAAPLYAQVAADAGSDLAVDYPNPVALDGDIVNGTPLEWWTADGNNTTEDMFLKWVEGTGLNAVGLIRTAGGTTLGWPSDLVKVGSTYYGTDVGLRRLYTLDPNTATATLIGSSAWSATWNAVTSLAYDATNDRLFAVDFGKRQLLRINRTTGATTAVGSQTLNGYTSVKSLAYDPAIDRLLAVDNATHWLLSIHPTTGVVTPLVVTTPVPNLSIEELDLFGGQLYASYATLSNGNLIYTQLARLDRSTGTYEMLGSVVPDCSAHVCHVVSLPEPVQWTQLDGPGVASFANAAELDTSVSFTEPGVYTLELAVFAQSGTVYDTVVVTVDGCPSDPAKLVPGICGCGVADIDSDSDGTFDCFDGCPSDPLKVSAGTCGCGVADTDSDGDGTADCNDLCASDPNKIAPGACGCGVPETDGDGDSTPDCIDGCPSDPLKIEAGTCGCGVADTDSDGDGTADCNDLCANDPNKLAPGVCGCGTADTDTDGDGTLDCIDGCPTDPLKIAAGTCGCGVADTDSDGDGTADCNDLCANDPNKLAPGVCGCGTADTDT